MDIGGAFKRWITLNDKKKLRLAIRLDELYRINGKHGMFQVLVKSYSLEQIKYLIALEEEEIKYNES